MKFGIHFLLCCVLLMFGQCKAQNKPSAALYLKDFKFNGCFGISVADSNTNYCLLGQGFFRAEHSTNTDNVIKEWIEKHPAAKVIKVSSLAIPKASRPNLNFTYCWLIDQNDTLNNELIKQGCYAGGTMQRPQTWSEMSREERSIYEEGDKPDVTVHIDSKTYTQFIEQVKAAEMYARNHKLGIWAKGEPK